MGYDQIRYEVANRIATVTLHRPERRNAVTYPMLEELLRAFDAADGDDDVRAIVVTGAGDYFSVGTDVSGDGQGFAPGSPEFKPLRGGDRDIGGEVAIRVFDCNKPVIAAVNGTAVGIGVTMTLPMDIRIAADDARFGLPFVRRAIVPESCASWFLPRVVGIARAVDWTLTGRIFPATEALDGGLVRELVPADRVLARAYEIAMEIAVQTAPVSVALTRHLMWRLLGTEHPIVANKLESEALIAVQRTPDTAEGIASFLEKRPPRFTLRPSRDVPDLGPSMPGSPKWDEIE
jgi:enoyl-CoA hydratase/carnithine racemase